LLKKIEALIWKPECNQSFDTLKEKLIITPILVYPNWKVEFYVHIDSFGIALGDILAQPGEGNMDHLIYFSSRKISQAECNYTTTEREGLEMLYALQKFRHYFLGSHFKLFIDHSSLKYIVNKHVLEGRICRWLLLFYEFSFEVIVIPDKLNVGQYHFSRLESEESGRGVDYHLLDAYLFKVESIPDYFSDIALFLSTGACH